ncbi:cytochrome c oxidase accessory protein CcoG (plasmid) [Pedobacter sp. BS3]|uniref:cytochrome c oxidase accessory protein CcoG n=1 Tax=Pedobacter sp. BS3 TaxID=2567937 RepID=UPI0011EEF337|nr:cytochrome c oxidase accessory protein CcoG [Pedobacter sp. BS3]TZF85637.1 cytochrome c oxidase accessory protein CcoG [Pedobacter sp. BS3]
MQESKGREWIYPKLVKGKLYRYRDALSWSLLFLLFAGPFIKVNGEQLLLLDVLNAKFVFAGLVFQPQDFYLFVLAMLIFIVFIVLFTAVFGRVWCGWACPQTIFMEMVFRKIERWIEGDAVRQKKLDQSPLTVEKILKKGAKHTIFLLISFLIANIFLAYIIGSDALLTIIREPVSQHLAGFIAILIFTLVFYGVFAYVREIVCTVICPYGRLQGVLLDKKSMIVGYDYGRGEPRGKFRKNQENVYGDCVDCGLCVQVCPTGIDIRNGTQLECINCTLCIDACDMVMDKLQRPRRLIGFKSEEEIETGKPFKLGKRIYGYSAVLLVLISVLAFMLIRRTDIEATVLRAGGTLYQLRDDKTVSNLYNAELINKTNHTIRFDITPEEPSAKIAYIRKIDSVPQGGSIKLTFFIIQPQANIATYKSTVRLNVVSGNKVVDRIETVFIAPPNL